MALLANGKRVISIEKTDCYIAIGIMTIMATHTTGCIGWRH
jgi:hypothetical protein